MLKWWHEWFDDDVLETSADDACRYACFCGSETEH